MRGRLTLGMLLLYPALAAAAPSELTTILDCNFDSKTVDQPLGTDGPAAGEPITLGGVPAVVRSAPFPTNCLEMTDNWGTGARQVRFEFLEGQAVSTGKLTFSFQLTFQALDSFSIYLREKSFSAVSFLNLRFSSDGSIFVDDLTGSSFFVGTYTTATAIPFVLSYDLDALTYTITAGGTPLISNSTLGSSMPQGIGAILIGLDHDVDSTGTFFLDDLKVTTGEEAQPVEEYVGVRQGGEKVEGLDSISACSILVNWFESYPAPRTVLSERDYKLG